MNPFKRPDGTINHQRIIAGLTVAVATFCVKFLSEDRLCAFLSLFIKNPELLDTALFVTLWVIDAGLFLGAFFLVSLIYKLIWKCKHRNYCLKGYWLHIHDKEKVRIGLVSIKQDFYDAAASGNNIDPTQRRSSGVFTEWDYIGNSFCNTKTNYFIGCYSAKRQDDSEKYGVHIFDEVKFSSKGHPIKMVGKFGDSIDQKQAHEAKVYDKTGKLYFYKLCKDGINISKQDLKTLLKNPTELKDPSAFTSLTGSEFEKDLSRILKKNKILKNYRQLVDSLETSSVGVSKQELDTWIFYVLNQLVFSDSHVSDNELDLLNDLLKTHWQDSDASGAMVAQFNFNDLVEKIVSNRTLYNSFKSNIKDICQYIVSADECTHKKEADFVKAIETYFHTIEEKIGVVHSQN